MTDREEQLHPANRLRNLRRRVARARNFPKNTCGASRHLHLIAEALARHGHYPMLEEEPRHCAGSMLSVLESLWKARTRIDRLERRLGIDVEAKREREIEKALARLRQAEAAKRS